MQQHRPGCYGRMQQCISGMHTVSLGRTLHVKVGRNVGIGVGMTTQWGLRGVRIHFGFASTDMLIKALNANTAINRATTIFVFMVCLLPGI